MLLWVVKGLFRRCWQTSDGPLSGREGELLSGQRGAGDCFGVPGRQIVRKTTGGVRHLSGQARDPRWWLRAREVFEGLPGDVALEHAHDLGA